MPWRINTVIDTDAMCAPIKIPLVEARFRKSKDSHFTNLEFSVWNATFLMWKLSWTPHWTGNPSHFLAHDIILSFSSSLIRDNKSSRGERRDREKEQNGNLYLLKSFYVPGTVWSTLYAWSHLLLIRTLWDKYYHLY